MDIYCPQKPCCLGSCQKKNVDNPDILQQVRAFFSSVGISSIQLHTGSPIHWRTRAKLAIRGSSNQPKIGLFEPGTHQIIDIPHCALHHPSINKTALALKQWITHHKIDIYDENSGLGLLRYVQFTVQRSTNKVQVVLVVNLKSINDAFKDKVDQFYQDNKEHLHSVWLNENTRRDNVIFGNNWILLHGEKWLWEKLSSREVCFHPASFMQANLEMFERLLEKLPNFVPPQSTILELYAGTGAIGLSLIENAKSLHCVEVVELAKQCFDKSIQKLDAKEKEKVTFSVGTSHQFCSLIDKRPNIIIIDPPRKGCGDLVLGALCGVNFPSRLIYVSCGWDSFQKECKELLLSGWSLTHAEAFLFFPGTDHLEILGVFERA